MKNKILLINALLILLFFNYSIYKQEKHIEEGILVLFELAPIDPRSLMQGDYMTLRYKMASEIRSALPDIDNESVLEQPQAVIELDTNNVAQFLHLQKKVDTLIDGQISVPLNYKNVILNLSLTTSYLFEEGQAKHFEQAKYGVFKYKDGKFILINLADENFVIL